MRNLIQSFFGIALFLMLIPAINVKGQTRFEARHFLMRTHRVINFAKEVVTSGKVYTGDVTKAVYHQRYARQLFKEGKFEKAIHQSYRARELAHTAIRANKHEIAKDMEFQEEEKGFLKNKPDNAALDVEVKIPSNAEDKVVVKEKEEEMKEQ